MSEYDKKTTRWLTFCFFGLIASLIMFFIQYSTLPNLKSGYRFKTDYLIGHFAFAWVPLVIFVLIIFLIKKSNNANNAIKTSSEISNTKSYEKPIIKKKSNSKNDGEEIIQKKIKVNTDEDIKRMNSKSEEDIYDLIGKEIEEKNLKRGIWTKAIAESNGDKEKAEAIYIRLRFEQLKSQ